MSLRAITLVGIIEERRWKLLVPKSRMIGGVVSCNKTRENTKRETAAITQWHVYWLDCNVFRYSLLVSPWRSCLFPAAFTPRYQNLSSTPSPWRLLMLSSRNLLVSTAKNDFRSVGSRINIISACFLNCNFNSCTRCKFHFLQCQYMLWCWLEINDACSVAALLLLIWKGAFEFHHLSSCCYWETPNILWTSTRHAPTPFWKPVRLKKWSNM